MGLKFYVGVQQSVGEDKEERAEAFRETLEGILCNTDSNSGSFGWMFGKQRQ